MITFDSLGRHKELANSFRVIIGPVILRKVTFPFIIFIYFPFLHPRQKPQPIVVT